MEKWERMRFQISHWKMLQKPSSQIVMAWKVWWQPSKKEEAVKGESLSWGILDKFHGCPLIGTTEYMAISSLAERVTWIQNLLKTLWIQPLQIIEKEYI